MSELWGKALEAAEEAALLMRAERYNGACSRAYYAMFNAARALLVERHGLSPADVKRHATLLRLFSLHFIESGLIDPEFGPLLRRASEARRIADYDETPVGATEARQALDALSRFMAVATAIRAA